LPSSQEMLSWIPTGPLGRLVIFRERTVKSERSIQSSPCLLQRNTLDGIGVTEYNLGGALKTLAVGRGAGGFEYDYSDDCAELGEFVDNLRIGYPTEILEWGTGNEILNLIEVLGSVCSTGNDVVGGVKLTPFCSSLSWVKRSDARSYVHQENPRSLNNTK